MSIKKPAIFDSLLPENRRQRQQIHDCCLAYERSPSKGHFKKLKAQFGAIGSDVFIEKGFYCDYANKIFIGDRVYINIRATFLDGGEIRIGNDVLIGPNVQILTVNHPLDATQRRQNISLVSDVRIANDVWIGAGVIVLPGVSIGEGVVVGAGSVVPRDLVESGVYVGNPATKI